MLDYLSKFASASSESGDLFSSLGIDWQVLILQTIAFIVLVFILAKFIYPQISAMLDRRDKAINDAMKAAKESEEKAAASEEQTTKLLATARDEAEDIIETAKKESADMLAEAEEEAAKRAFNIVAAAQADLEKEVESARKALRAETLDLVAMATEKVASVKLGVDDEKIIKKTLGDDK